MHDNIIHLVSLTILLMVAAVGVRVVSKRLALPFTVLLVLSGMLLAQLAAQGVPGLAPLDGFELSPELILFIFLPTLIFESAFNLDSRQLRHNLAPILALAIPGLILSTLLIGLLVHWLTGVELMAALLLGAILSATDPVAVIALFKQVGAPSRLTVLVEGESLFNDATAIVASHILLALVLAGQAASTSFGGAAFEFLLVFFGGALVGWLCAYVAGNLLGMVEGDPFIEISLTTILAYLSFLLAEHLLHVSGVMAAVAAGVTMGGWGSTKISPSVREYMANFWHYLSDLANALIFLLVGLQIGPLSLFDEWYGLLVVILAMLLSRAAVIFGLLPAVERLPGTHAIDPRFRLVLYWGGLRGAIALALVLSLPDFPYKELFTTLVAGAVLFTLLLPGLTVEPLVRRLGLTEPPLVDRLAEVEGTLTARRRALKRLATLKRRGWFSKGIARRLRNDCESRIRDAQKELEALRQQELTPQQEHQMVFLNGLGVERSFYYEMFSRGDLSERAYRDLIYSLDSQIDALRHGIPIPAGTLHGYWRSHGLDWWIWLLVKVLHLPTLADGLKRRRIARDYEVIRARVQAGPQVLRALTRLGKEDPEREAMIKPVRQRYQAWFDAARQRLDDLSEEYPLYINTMQHQLAERMLIHSQQEAIRKQTRSGALPADVAQRIEQGLDTDLKNYRRADLQKITMDPHRLLRKVPVFRNAEPHDLHLLTRFLHAETIEPGRDLIKQDEIGDSLYLLASGVATLMRLTDEGEVASTTLFAGDYIGEAVLLGLAPADTVTAQARTTCVVYRLSAAELDLACAEESELLELVLRARRMALGGSGLAFGGR
jgi:CPA1 family monovalent cation:H+ antiporter